MTKFVEKFEQMNPETECLVLGNLLQNGMEILDADPSNRVNMSISHAHETWEYDRARERNRWCKISHLKFDNEFKLYRFVATYEDGTQRLRNSEPNKAWFVKLDSVDVLHKKRVEVREKIEAGLLMLSNGGSPETYDGKIDTVTNEILTLFGMGVSK